MKPTRNKVGRNAGVVLTQSLLLFSLVVIPFGRWANAYMDAQFKAHFNSVIDNIGCPCPATNHNAKATHIDTRDFTEKN